jgi:hypothetical protein
MRWKLVDGDFKQPCQHWTESTFSSHQHVHWDPIGRSNQQEGNMNEVRYLDSKETASKPLDHPWGGEFDK